jgi:hypothetical protein
MSDVSTYSMSIEELEAFILTYPRNSACARADVLMFEQLLETKKQKLAEQSANGLIFT